MARWCVGATPILDFRIRIMDLSSDWTAIKLDSIFYNPQSKFQNLKST